MKATAIGLIIAMWCAIMSAPANANTYDANATVGKITNVMVFTYTTRVLFTADMPPSSPDCDDIFELPASLPDAIRQNLLSRLLLAYSSGLSINIGYDSQSCSPNGNIWVGRVG